MESNKISVIIPIYKVPEQYLKKCIESLMGQTYNNIEIILVDDGSPDNCGAVCDGYEGKDNRIIVIHKSNEGLSAARNSGYSISTGDWIMFVDGDDWIDSNTCETMLKVALEKKVQLVMCGMQKEYGNTSLPYKYYLEDGKVYIGEECKWLQEQLLHYNCNIAVAYCKLINRRVLADNDINHDSKLRQGAEGLEFNLRLFEKLESAVFINKPFYHYIYNDNSISASHNEANHELVVKCFERIKEYVDSCANKDVLRPWLYNRLLYVVITTAISGYFNPLNTEPYANKKKKYLAYLENTIIKEALQTKNIKGLGKRRLIILFMIKYHMFYACNIMGKLRKWQKDRR